MAKVKRIPLGLEPGQQRIELRDRVSVELALLVGTVKEGLLAFAVGVGMQVFRTTLESVDRLLDGPALFEPYRVHSTRFGVGSPPPSRCTCG